MRLIAVAQESREHHFTAEGRLGVYRTSDGGGSWELASSGLPARAWAAVLREGFVFDENGVYLGTQSGSVWTAPQGGGEWVEAARDLPPILSVEAAGELRRLINVYVDGVDARNGRLLDDALEARSEVRIVGAVAGGWRPPVTSPRSECS